MAGLALAVSLVAPVSASAYTYSKVITIDRARLSVGSCGTTLTDFPMLFSVTDPELRHTLSGGRVTDLEGDDILFRAVDASTCGGPGACVLDHEIERYEPTTGELVAWVRLPSVNTAAAASDTSIRIHYGNSAVTTPINSPTSVWSAGYAGVWHLHDDLLDSTVNANHGTPAGTTNASPAQVADGQSFNGVGDYVQTPSTDLQTPDTFTISTWFRADATTTPRHLLWQGAAIGNGWGDVLAAQPPPVDEMHISIGDILPATTGVTPNYLSFTLGDTDGGSNGTPDILSVRTPFTDTAGWHQVTVVVSNMSTAPRADLYLDGSFVMSDTGTIARTPRGAWDTALRFGRPGTSSRYFDGRLDEVRIATGSRSACWIGAEHDNQLDPGDVGAPGFYSIGRTMIGGFQHYKPVTVQRARIPSGCSSTTLTDFPMLFSVTDPDLRQSPTGDVTDPEGDDIVFMAFDDVTCGGVGSSPCWLDHEIERYTPGTGELIAWVRLPSVNKADAASDTAIYMYYGNPNITTSTENAAGVWGTDHVGVWHLGETLADETIGGGVHADSSSPAHDGNHNNSAPFTGVIAGGQDFDGTDDSIPLGDDDAFSFTGGNPFSVSAWIWTDTGTRNVIMAKEGPALGPSEWDFYVRSSGALTLIAMDNRFSNRIGIEATTGFPTGAWHHVAGTYDGGATSAGMVLYVDGLPATTGDYSAGTYTGMSNTTQPLLIGGYNGGGNNYDMDGRIDELRLSNVVRSSCWIGGEYASHSDPGDIGYAGFYIIGAAVTAVELVSFEATPLDGAVRLTWETASESQNLGFHLYRSTSELGPWEPVTAELIPGLGSSAEGARYGYTDRGRVNGATVFYLLEDVETTGARMRHGPVSATPYAGAGSPDGEAGGPGNDPTVDAGSWIRYGDPDATRLQVLSRGPQQAVLELTTGGFYALPQQDGTVELRVPGFDPLDEAGAPDLPVRRAWVDAVAGQTVAVKRVQVRDVETFSSLRPADAGVAEMLVDADGTVRAGSRAVAKRLPTGDGLFPEQAARLLEVGFQGELKKALLELAPMRWDAVSGQVLLARRLEVTVSFAGRDASERVLGGSRGRKKRNGGGRPVDEARVVAYLSAPTEGAYGVAFEEVFPGARRPVSSASLRLSRRGSDVAFHVAPDPRRFGPGSTLHFVSRGAGDNPDARAAVYALESGVAGTVMDVREGRPAGPGLLTGRVVRRYESDLLYLNGILEISDPWMWTTVVAPRARSFPFELERVAAGAPGRLQVDLVGATDTVVSPDHHVAVSVNGVLVADVSWDGKDAVSIDAGIPSGVLREGANSLEVHDRGDTGASISAIYFDRFAVEYARELVADAGSVEAAFDASGQAQLGGLGGGAVLFDTTDPEAPAWIEGGEWTGTALAVSVEAGHRLLAVAPAALGHPGVRLAGDLAALLDRTGWDYVAVGPRELLEAAQPLLQWRRDQGLTVFEAATEDVYDAFSGGETHTGAIRDFVAYAFHEWPAPPRYVLLLGDASYDGKGRRGFADRNHVPPFMIRTPYMWTISDAAYAAVNGDDDLPDVAIGRLPAADAGEARALALKVVSRERDGYRFDDATAYLVADNADTAGDFSGDAEEIAGSVLAGRDVEVLRLDQLGGAMRPAIHDAFDGGAGVVSWLGHGAIALWASENVFNNNDVKTLAPQPQQPLLLTMSCLNGYILHPLVDSLAEVLLKAEGAGAAAAFSPSSLSIHTAARRYHDALLEEVLSGRHGTLGDALVAAQASYAAQGALPDLLASYLLLGDPAASLR